MGQVVKKATESGGKKIRSRNEAQLSGYNIGGGHALDSYSAPIRFSGDFDATHSVQLPGGGGDKSSGKGRFAPGLGPLRVVAVRMHLH